MFICFHHFKWSVKIGHLGFGSLKMDNTFTKVKKKNKYNLLNLTHLLRYRSVNLTSVVLRKQNGGFSWLFWPFYYVSEFIVIGLLVLNYSRIDP